MIPSKNLWGILLMFEESNCSTSQQKKKQLNFMGSVRNNRRMWRPANPDSFEDSEIQRFKNCHDSKKKTSLQNP